MLTPRDQKTRLARWWFAYQLDSREEHSLFSMGETRQNLTGASTVIRKFSGLHFIVTVSMKFRQWLKAKGSLLRTILYVTEPAGLDNSPENGIIQPQSFPLYDSLRRFAAGERFKEEGMHIDRPRKTLSHLLFTNDPQEEYLGYTAPTLTPIAREWRNFSSPED